MNNACTRDSDCLEHRLIGTAVYLGQNIKKKYKVNIISGNWVSRFTGIKRANILFQLTGIYCISVFKKKKKRLSQKSFGILNAGILRFIEVNF